MKKSRQRWKVPGFYSARRHRTDRTHTAPGIPVDKGQTGQTEKRQFSSFWSVSPKLKCPLDRSDD